MVDRVDVEKSTLRRRQMADKVRFLARCVNGVICLQLKICLELLRRAKKSFSSEQASLCTGYRCSPFLRSHNQLMRRSVVWRGHHAGLLLKACVARIGQWIGP